ncbi:MAG: dihydrolipoyl dehydrogenase [Bacillota bacterium]
MRSEIAVIGGGPGGYAAALRAAQKGIETIIIEKDTLGGTCLNVGCIPTKSLLASTGVVNEINKWKGQGIKIGNIDFELNKLMDRKNKIVNQLVKGVTSLIKSNENIKLIRGKAKIVNKDEILIKKSNGENITIKSNNIIIATGSEPIEISNFSFNNKYIWDNTDALSIKKIPDDLLIVGAGVVGVEFANIYNNLGSNVTIIEKMDGLLPNEEKIAGNHLKEIFNRKGIDIFLDSEVQDYEEVDGKMRIKFSKGNVFKNITVDKLLIAVGRRPVLKNIGLDEVDINYSKKGIDVNNRMETNIDNIYAVGDVNGNYQLAHVAFQEAIVAVDNALGGDQEINYTCVPRCIYTQPEIAAVGLTEKQAIKKYGDNIKVGSFPYNANGRALSEKEDGLVKTIVETEYNQIVGMLIIGSHATELIGQGTIAIRLESTVETLEDIIFPHPTLSEMIKESVLDSLDRAVHI